ncbi:hypothetical protein Ciccas_014341, partial [Cichlidogyrus casuarinus]
DYVLTQLQVETPGGGYPLCYFIHKKQLAQEYLLMFELLFRSNPTPFNGHESPQYILTDDSKGERKAIQIALRQAQSILCEIHVKRNIKSYKVETGKQRAFEKLAKAIVTETSLDKVTERIEDLVQSGVAGQGFRMFTNRLIKDSQSMVRAFRENTPRNRSTNSLESDWHVIKAKIFRGAFTMSIHVVIERILSDADVIYFSKLVKKAQKVTKGELVVQYEKIMQTVSAFEEISQNFHRFRHTNGDIFCITTEPLNCTCEDFHDGNFCAHAYGLFK